MELKVLAKAQEILKKNEKGGFIMPDAGYYEGAWLWDTGFIEIGEAQMHPEKAAERLESWLSQAQWKNGFLPHILFFAQKTKKYFPGPDIWQHDLTSGITQPPVLGFCALRIYESLKEKSPQKARQFLKAVYPRLFKYHRLLFEERDPEKSGLVSIFHPWESGLDNSPRWEEALSKIMVSDNQVKEAKNSRKDILNKKTASMRPTNQDYARYLYLVRFMAERGYDNQKIYPEIPFNIKDVLFNSVLYASNEALILMAVEGGEKAEEIKNWLYRQRQGLEGLFDQETGLYYDQDVKSGQLIKRKTIACFVPLFAGIPSSGQAQKMAEIASGPEFKGDNPLFLIPSTARTDPSFHPLAYWRGPVWLPVNWLVLRGFERAGLAAEDKEMTKTLLQLILKKGFWEYYNPDTNKGLGRADFSWTASLAIDLAKEPNFWKKLWRVG